MTVAVSGEDEELRLEILELFASDTTYLIPSGVSADLWYANTIIGLVRKHDIDVKIATVQIVDSHLRLEGIPLRPTQTESLKQYLKELEAQKEGLQQ